jgi:hypothetical protein
MPLRGRSDQENFVQSEKFVFTTKYLAGRRADEFANSFAGHVDVDQIVRTHLDPTSVQRLNQEGATVTSKNFCGDNKKCSRNTI